MKNSNAIIHVFLNFNSKFGLLNLDNKNAYKET